MMRKIEACLGSLLWVAATALLPLVALEPASGAVPLCSMQSANLRVLIPGATEGCPAANSGVSESGRTANRHWAG
ncbi:MAG TPA: hypothetical protein VGB59_04965 [Allosphingosinicella sp.]